VSSAPTVGGFVTYSSTASTDQKTWAIQHGSAVGDGTLRIRAINDASNNGINALIFSRTGIASVVANFPSTTASTGVGTGALQVAGGIYAGAASVFGGAVTVSGTATSSFSGSVRLPNAGTLIFYTAAAASATGMSLTAGDVLKVGQSNANITSTDIYGGTGNVTINAGASLAATFSPTTATFAGAVTIGGTGFLSAARSVYTTGAVATPIANSAVMDWSGGFARFWGVGADAATAGGLKLVVSATDTSPFIEALTIDSTGAATFGTTNVVTMAAGVLTATSASANGLVVRPASGNSLAIFDASAGGADANAYITLQTSGTNRWVFGQSISTAAGDFEIYSTPLGASALKLAKATGAATFAGAVSASGTTATWTSGTGSPESVKTAPVGSLYTRTDGGASTTLYVKESGAGNTGWIAK
jgi:hypothetical protein